MTNLYCRGCGICCPDRLCEQCKLDLENHQADDEKENKEFNQQTRAGGASLHFRDKLLSSPGK